METLKRDYSVDALAGILIIYMVLVHVFQLMGIYSGKLLYNMQFLNFYVPYFFYKSGMFFNKKSTAEVIRHGGGKFLIPFLKYSILGHGVYCICLLIGRDYNWIHYVLTPIKALLFSGSVPGNPPTWFLLSLLVARIMANYLLYHCSRFVLLLIICLCFCLGWAYYAFHVTKPDYLLNITTGLGFFLMGYMMKQWQYRKEVFFLCVIVYAIFSVFCFTSVEMRHNLLERGVYILWPITCLAGIVAISNCLRLLPIQSSNPLVFVGKHSMQLLVWHFPIIFLIYTLVKNL